MSIITRKITLYPQGDKEEVNRVYTYLRNGMEYQAQMMNQCISAMYSMRLKRRNKPKWDDEDKEEWKNIKKHYSHKPGSAKGSPYTDPENKYPIGLPIASNVPRVCEKNIKKACKEGLIYGKVSLPTYKKDMPLMVHNDYVSIMGTKMRKNGATIQTGLYSDYTNMDDIINALHTAADPGLHIKFANGIIFDIVLGSIHSSLELRSVFEKIFMGEYHICDSSIGISKKKNKIMLYLVLDTPKKEHTLDEGTVVGVDLGLAYPAVCALNNDMYHREYIGSYNDLTRQRQKIQSLRRSITKQLKTASGGHGRNAKLKHLDKVKLHERAFVQSYNHMVSREVIKFALKYNAKYINLENLSGFSDDDKHKFVLRNWSYYELQQMIQYKAEKEGITVRFINPKLTSQTCSVCGQKGIRSVQSVFTCSDPNCKVHTMYQKPINADFNGARNIAMSKDFTTDLSEDINK